jgi:DNA primase
MQVSVVTLDQGQDPDSFVRKHGVEGFQQRIGQAVSLFEYKLRQLKQAHDVGSVEGKAKIADGMLATIARYQNEVAKSEYIRQLSAAIGIPQNVLWSQMTKSPTEISASRRQAAPLPKPVRLEKTAEYYLLRLLLLDKRWIEASRQDLQPDDIQNEMIKSLVELINAQYAQGKNIRGSELIQACQDEQTQSLVTGLMSEENLSSDDQAKVYRDCMQRIKKKRLQDRRKVLTEQIRAAEQSGDSHEVNKLKEEFNQLIRG